MIDKKFFIDGAEKILPPVNDTPYKRILAVGDVHGKFAKLTELWKKLSVTDDDLVIFLGDYVDRGEGVAETLEWVIEMSTRKNFVFLRGNHEQMLLNAFSDVASEFTGKFFSDKDETLSGDDMIRHGETVAWIVYNGGDMTINALKNFQRTKKFPVDEILNFVRGLPLSYLLTVGGRQYFFCHAGVDSAVPLENQSEEFLLWAREKFFNRYDGDAVIIGGHTPIQLFEEFGNDKSPRPLKFPDRNILMMDTGAYISGGEISAVDILTGACWQSGDATTEIIFVCAWNTCRSAMAEYIMRQLIDAAGLAKKIRVDSAGCITEGGEPLGRRTRQVLAENNIAVGAHVSKAFTADMYKNFDCVVALDEGVLRLLKKKFGDDPDKKIRLLADADGNQINVEDPGSSGEHAEAYAAIMRGCRALLAELTK